MATTRCMGLWLMNGAKRERTTVLAMRRCLVAADRHRPAQGRSCGTVRLFQLRPPMVSGRQAAIGHRCLMT